MRKNLKNCVLVSCLCLVTIAIGYLRFGDWTRRSGPDTHMVLQEFIALNNEDGAIHMIQSSFHIGGGFIVYDLRLTKEPVSYFLKNSFEPHTMDACPEVIPEYFELTTSNLPRLSDRFNFDDFHPTRVFSKDVNEKNARVFLESATAGSSRAILLVMVP